MGYSKTVNARAFKPLPLCSAPLKTLLIGISGAQKWKKVINCLCKNMFCENAVEYLWNWWLLELSSLCHCAQHPWKLTSRDDCSTKNERKPVSTLKHVWETVNSSNLCHCVQHPWKLPVGKSLGLKESHFLSKTGFWEFALGMMWGIQHPEC